MKFIEKGVEPEEFLEWKRKDKMFLRGRPNWNRLPSNIKNLLRETISIEQGFICCYCERNLSENDFHLEHIRPKDINKFPKNQLDYDNLLCSCQLELDAGEPRHCANSKGSWFQTDDFISPLNEDCEEKFKYTADGYILPSDEDDVASITTINKLRLGIDKLNALRREVITPFIDENLTNEDLMKFVNGYLVDKSNNNGKFN